MVLADGGACRRQRWTFPVVTGRPTPSPADSKRGVDLHHHVSSTSTHLQEMAMQHGKHHEQRRPNRVPRNRFIEGSSRTRVRNMMAAGDWDEFPSRQSPRTIRRNRQVVE